MDLADLTVDIRGNLAPLDAALAEAHAKLLAFDTRMAALGRAASSGPGSSLKIWPVLDQNAAAAEAATAKIDNMNKTVGATAATSTAAAAATAKVTDAAKASVPVIHDYASGWKQLDSGLRSTTTSAKAMFDTVTNRRPALDLFNNSTKAAALAQAEAEKAAKLLTEENKRAAKEAREFALAQREAERQAAAAARTTRNVVLGIAAVVAAFTTAMVVTVKWANALEDLSTQTGLSTDKLQVLRFAAVEAGGSAREMDQALLRLTRNIGQAAEGQGQLAETMRLYKINVTDGSGATRNAANVMNDIADRIKNAKSAAEASRISMAAFGRELGDKMIPILKDGAQSFTQLEARARELGVVMSREMVQKADEAGKSLDKAWFILKQKLLIALAELAPLVEAVADAIIVAANGISKFVELVDDVSKDVQAAFSAIISYLTDTFTPYFKAIEVVLVKPFEDAVAAIERVVEGIVNVFDAIITTITNAWRVFVSFLTKHLKDEVNVLITLINASFVGLGKIAPLALLGEGSTGVGQKAADFSTTPQSVAERFRAERERLDYEAFLRLPGSPGVDKPETPGGRPPPSRTDSRNAQRELDRVQKMLDKLDVEARELMATLEKGPNMAEWAKLEEQFKKLSDDTEKLTLLASKYWDTVRLKGLVTLKQFSDDTEHLRRVTEAEATGRQELVRQLEYEHQLRQQMGERAAQMHDKAITQMAAERVALEQHAEKMREVRDIIVQNANMIGDAIENSILASINDTGNAAENLSQIWKRVMQDMLAQAIRFAAINPLKNELFGENLPTLGNIAEGIGNLSNKGVLGKLGGALSGLKGESLFGMPLVSTQAMQVGGRVPGGTPTSSTVPAQTGLLNTAAGVLGGAATGFGIGSLLGGLNIGLKQEGAQIGGAIGGAIGAAVGSFIPVIGTVLGGLIGSAGGSFLGGLFGPKPSVGPNSGAQVNFAGGRALVTGVGADNGGSIENGRVFGQGVADAINRTMAELGASSARIGGLAARVWKDRFEIGFGLGTMASGTDAEQVVRQAVFQMVKGGHFAGMGERITTAIAHSAATDLDSLFKDIEFARNLDDIIRGLEATGNALKQIEKTARDAAQQQIDAIVAFVDKARQLGFASDANTALEKLTDQLLSLGAQEDQLSDTQRTLAALAATFEVVRNNAVRLNLTESEIANRQAAAMTELREGFDEGIMLQLLRLVDPLSAALEEFDRIAQQRLDDAIRLGANLLMVEELNALERQRIIEQANQQQLNQEQQLRDSLTRFLEELTFGSLSGASPLTSAAGARATFQAAVAQGDVGRFEELGRQLVTLSRSAFGSSLQFQQDLDLVRNVIGEVIGGPDNSIVGAIDDFANENIRLTTIMASELGMLRQQQAEQSVQIAQLNSLLERYLRAA